MGVTTSVLWPADGRRCRQVQGRAGGDERNTRAPVERRPAPAVEADAASMIGEVPAEGAPVGEVDPGQRRRQGRWSGTVGSERHPGREIHDRDDPALVRCRRGAGDEPVEVDPTGGRRLREVVVPVLVHDDSTGSFRAHEFREHDHPDVVAGGESLLPRPVHDGLEFGRGRGEVGPRSLPEERGDRDRGQDADDGQHHHRLDHGEACLGPVMGHGGPLPFPCNLRARIGAKQGRNSAVNTETCKPDGEGGHRPTCSRVRVGKSLQDPARARFRSPGPRRSSGLPPTRAGRGPGTGGRACPPPRVGRSPRGASPG